MFDICVWFKKKVVNGKFPPISILQANGKIIANGIKDNKHLNSLPMAKNHEKPKESFEPIPLVAACLTYMGFYFLMLLGFLNQLLFTPKVATERNREVSHLSAYFLSHCLNRLMALIIRRLSIVEYGMLSSNT